MSSSIPSLCYHLILVPNKSLFPSFALFCPGLHFLMPRWHLLMEVLLLPEIIKRYANLYIQMMYQGKTCLL